MVDMMVPLIVAAILAVFVLAVIGDAVRSISKSLKSIAEDVKANTYRKP